MNEFEVAMRTGGITVYRADRAEINGNGDLYFVVARGKGEPRLVAAVSSGQWLSVVKSTKGEADDQVSS